jgi:NAD(P)-dependent dehydrogenase (short-subunit alcohol dehydrogenase family)
MKNFTDRVAVITGAGGGIGRAICMELARRGAHIAAVDVDEAGLAEVRGEVEALGRRCSVHGVDVADRVQMEALPGRVLAEHGAVHILVNNAGVSVNLTFREQDIDDLEWITGINYWGVIYGCKFFLPHLLAVDEAHIVNISSSAGFTGMKYQTSYAATKFAVTGFSESLYVELSPTNVGITCVHPGAVATNILEAARMDTDRRSKMLKSFKYATPPEHAARTICKAIERKRFKQVLCVDSRVLHFIKRLAPVGTLKLMRLFNARGSSEN